MTKKQVLLGIIIALTAAMALDIGIFVIIALFGLYVPPADFDYTENTFTVIHYNFVWSHYLVEAAAIFGIFTMIIFSRNRFKNKFNG